MSSIHTSVLQQLLSGDSAHYVQRAHCLNTVAMTIRKWLYYCLQEPLGKRVARVLPQVTILGEEKKNLTGVINFVVKIIPLKDFENWIHCMVRNENK